ncbi:unnamed protein product [Phytophthora lilii]|uniref:Unnamed protein product n=1 Tax=Phytophthora lilii TaxID=2077276 RepID=A0A9W6UCI6_9STRA|nr:unnamed protein product [Phytophthora lilii]
MPKKAANSCCSDGDDWLVVGCDDSSRESAADSPQRESNGAKTTDRRGVEALQEQNQILAADENREQVSEALKEASPELQMEQEAETNQTTLQTAKEQHWSLFQLVDEGQKPLVVAADRNCLKTDMQSMVQEMVIMQRQLREVFPQVTRENVNDVIQVCERLDDKKTWMPLGRVAGGEELRCTETTDAPEDSDATTTARLQLTSKLDGFSEKHPRQLLVESKFEVHDGVEITDWRRGRFYSDVQKNAWRFQLQIGQLIDALDTDKRWYESRVVDLDAVYVKVHYRGWTSKWDEWLRRSSLRLAPLHTKVPNWRAFQVGDEVMVGSEMAGKKYPEWRNARVTASDTEDDRLQIEVEVDGKKKWLDAQDELLCPKGTHKAVNAGANVTSAVLATPPSLLPNYFERPKEEDDSLSIEKENTAHEIEAVREATHVMHLGGSDADGDEWCVVDEESDEESTSAEGNPESSNQAESAVADRETGDFEGGVADPESNAITSDEQSAENIAFPAVNPVFATTTEVVDGRIDPTIRAEDAWRYELQIDQLIDGRDTDNVWYVAVAAMNNILSV